MRLADPFDQLPWRAHGGPRSRRPCARSAGVIQRGTGRSSCGESAGSPRRAELWPRRREQEQRRLRSAARPERARGRAKSDRPSAGPRRRARRRAWDRAPARTHAVIAASCLRRNSSSAGKFRQARSSGGSGMSTSGASSGACSAGSRPIRPQRVFEVGEALFGGQDPRQNAAGPIRRLDAAACSAK